MLLYIGGKIQNAFWPFLSIAKHNPRNIQLGLYLCAIASWNTRAPRRANSSRFTLKRSAKLTQALFLHVHITLQQHWKSLCWSSVSQDLTDYNVFLNHYNE